MIAPKRLKTNIGKTQKRNENGFRTDNLCQGQRRKEQLVHPAETVFFFG
jgi:hypothetical protein